MTKNDNKESAKKNPEKPHAPEQDPVDDSRNSQQESGSVSQNEADKKNPAQGNEEPVEEKSPTIPGNREQHPNV